MNLENNNVESITSEIIVDFEDFNQSKIVYESILLEINTAPDYRSSIDLKLDNDKIIINIDAEDSTSFRASFNSAIKWIKLSLEVNNLTK